MRVYATLFCIILGGMLVAATGDFPDYGDPQSPRVLVGRKEFVEAAQTKATAKELKVLRVKVTSDEEFEELKTRVEESKGALDPPASPPEEE